MYTILKDSSVIAGRMSLQVMVQLYKKNIWYLHTYIVLGIYTYVNCFDDLRNDAKTVNVIATACFSPVTKVHNKCKW